MNKKKKKKELAIDEDKDDYQENNQNNTIPFSFPFVFRLKESDGSKSNGSRSSKQEKSSEDESESTDSSGDDKLESDDNLPTINSNEQDESAAKVPSSSRCFPQIADRVYFLRAQTAMEKQIESLIIGLHSGEELHLVGSGEVLCVAGVADILGYRLQCNGLEGSYRTFHSARYQGCLRLEAKGAWEKGDVKQTGNQCTEDSPTSVEHAKDMLLSKGLEVILLLRSLCKKRFDALLTSKKDAIAIEDPKPEFSRKIDGLHVSFVSPCGRGFWPVTIEPPWKNIADTLVGGAPETGATSFMITGAKGVGKSTFCRYLINRLLNRFPKVAVLDLDVGQPEFTPPGILSLSIINEPVLSPPAMHVTTPIQSCFLGASTTKGNPALFTFHVRYLAQFYRERFGLDSSFLEQTTPPLVINTDGWVRGLGLELLGAVVDILSPNHLIKLINPNKPSTKFPLEGSQSTRVYEIDGGGLFARSSGGGKATASTLRAHRLVNYFISGFTSVQRDESSEIIEVRSGDIHDPGSSISNLFVQQIPYTVPWQAIKLRFMGQAVVPSEAFHCLNGSLVGLLKCDPAQYPVQPPGSEKCKVFVLAQDPTGECLGLGIVKTICPIKHEYYILTPLQLSQLQHCNCFAQGSLVLPAIVYQNSSFCIAPHLSAEAISGHGAVALKSRKNLKRTGHQLNLENL